jgi:carotenoid cleavage dioxygenase-like enzyme
MINGTYGGQQHRYSWSVTGEPGWFLFNGLVKHDNVTGEEKRLALPPGVFASEAPMAPRIGSTAEDDGYLLTFTIDTNADLSEALILTAEDLDLVARIRLPHRISSGTHSCWAPLS